MDRAGDTDMRVVQNNVSFNARRGVTTRRPCGPWDKFVSVAAGSVFGAWVDLRQEQRHLREGLHLHPLDPSRAIYVPRGVSSSFQALEDGTAYTYLVDAHWSAELKKDVHVRRPRRPRARHRMAHPLSEATLSEADEAPPDARGRHPHGAEAHARHGLPRPAGAGRAGARRGEGITGCLRLLRHRRLRPLRPGRLLAVRLGPLRHGHQLQAYTAVDRAETPEGACPPGPPTRPGRRSSPGPARSTG